MNIVFLTTQSAIQSTVLGRVIPLAKEFQAMGHSIVLFLHEEQSSSSRVRHDNIDVRITGTNPFSRSEDGKKRYSGLYLIWIMKLNALRAAWNLIMERPDVIILVKPLPENTLAAFLAKLFLWNTKIILDVDDFELFANNLSSLFERSAIHASERVAVWLSSSLVVATPFLYDHMHQMNAGKKKITIIPTGLPAEVLAKAGVDVAEHANHSIIYIGSISSSSGHMIDLLPEILSLVKKNIPDATLTLAGSGDDTRKLQERFASRNLTDCVTYTGRFSPQDAASLVAQHMLIIDPVDASIVNRAKSSFRTALALACGIPVITSSIGIRTEMIPQELHEKFFAVPGDAKSYADRVVALINNPITEHEQSLLKEKSKEYTWEVLARTYANLL